MTGDELRTIRKRLGMSRVAFGRALGYRGNANTVNVAIAVYERGDRPLPPWIARLAVMYDRHGVPPEFMDPG